MSHIGKLFYCCVPQCGGLASLTMNRAVELGEVGGQGRGIELPGMRRREIGEALSGGRLGHGLQARLSRLRCASSAPFALPIQLRRARGLDGERLAPAGEPRHGAQRETGSTVSL